MELPDIFISDYQYELSRERIAEFPLRERDQSKLLVYENGVIQDDHFYHLPHYLPPSSTLVLNNTRVIEARLLFQKTTGAIIELFCLEPFEQGIEQALAQKSQVQWNCLIGGASKWKPGQILEKKILIEEEPVVLQAKFIGKQTDSFIIGFFWQTQKFSFAEILHAAGAIPLPPYIKRNPVALDEERYQTIFGRYEGSVAAPTAALHFTPAVFDQLAEKNIQSEYVTLHVGAGTFKPVKTETISEHQMHQESFTVSSSTLKNLIASERIIAVGTTSLRTLESLYWLGIKAGNGLLGKDWILDQWEAYTLKEKYGEPPFQKILQSLIDWMEHNGETELHCQTSLIIVPGYSCNIPSALLTNFHQPRSTLLLLVAAFVGEDWKKIYQHALDHQYRFLSYGDSSLLWRK